LEIYFISKGDRVGGYGDAPLEYFLAVADEVSFSRGAA
jgi:hypothetical protein